VVKLNINLTGEQKNLIKSVITRVPRNEEEVKRIFYKLEDTLSFQDVKEFVSFPDASAFYEGREINIEFEYRSSNFKKHGHEEKDCDLIVCWEDDDCSLKVRVLELSTLAENWLKIRQDLMIKYAGCLSTELGGVEDKAARKERARIESLMEKYQFDADDAIAEYMQITKPTLHYYYCSLDYPECVGGRLECVKRRIETKYLDEMKASSKFVPIVLCKDCQNKSKCRLGHEQQIGYYFPRSFKSATPRKVYFEVKEIKNEKILSHVETVQLNLWKELRFRRR
jgi:hypothetical protein